MAGLPQGGGCRRHEGVRGTAMKPISIHLDESGWVLVSLGGE